MKTCKYGDHPIDEEADRGHVTFYSRNTTTGESSETYACFACDKQQRIAEYEKDGIIQSSLWTDSILINHDHENGVERGDYAPWVASMTDSMRAVAEVGKVWEREVWFGGIDPSEDDARTEPYDGLGDMGYRQYKEDEKGRRLPGMAPEGSLQAFVLDAIYKGYSAEVGGLKYLSYTMCGRSIFQVEDAETGHFVSMIMDETSPQPRSGVRSVHATGDEAVAMMQRAIDDWKAGKITLIHGEGVGFGF